MTSEERIQLTAKLTLQGKSLTQIAKMLDVEVRTVSVYRKRAGVTVSPDAPPKWEERSARVAELTEQGLTAQAIATQLRVNKRTVVRDRHRMGISQVGKRLTQEEIETAWRLLEDGAGYNETARTIKCAPTTLQDKFPGMGMDPKERVRGVTQ